MSAPIDKAVSPAHPWLGLSAYTEATRGYFFGRQREITELQRRIANHPLTVLYGRSGLGKTSLLGAGLVPALRTANHAPRMWRFQLEPDAPSLLAQLHALHDTGGTTPGQSLWERTHTLPQGDEATGSQTAAPMPVLIFDQFEELFTLGWERRRSEVDALFAELADVIENRMPSTLREQVYQQPELLERYHSEPARLRILITLREDFLAQLESYRALLPALIDNRMALRELRGPDAQLVVLQPARLVVHQPAAGAVAPLPLVEPEVAHEIVCFVAKRPAGTPLEDIEAVPPLLSLLCAELNAVRIEKIAPQITQAQLQGEAEHVLERFYQRSFDGMPGGVRKAVEDLLIDSGGRIREASSRDTLLSEMRAQGVEEPERCLAALVDGRLLTIEERAGAPRVELTHDLLVPLVARARERRQAEEKAEAERVEAERQAAVERERLAAAELTTKQARAAQRRARLVSVVMAVLLLLALMGGWQAWERTQVARKAASDAQAAEAKAQAGLEQAAERALGRAREQFVFGEHENYVAYLAESIGFEFAIAADGAALAMQQSTSPKLRSAFEHKRAVIFVAFSPDGTRVVTASDDGSAHLWDAQSGAAIGAPLKHEKKVWSAAFSPDGTRVVTASDDNIARLWDVQSGAAIGAPLKHEGRVDSAAFSPDGTRVVTASWDNTARLWDAQSGAAIGAPLKHDKEVWSAAFSPDGRRVVTASVDNTARLWDAQSGAAIGAPLKHEEAVFSAVFSPDGTRVVTVSRDNTARLWDAQSGAAIGAPLKHEEAIFSAVFSPDGTRVVTVSRDNTARLWDAQSGAAIGTPLMHEKWVTSATFSPGGRRVVTASFDNTARLWNAQSAAAIGAPLRHEKVVWSAAFSPDGTRVVTASFDNTARLWDAQSGAAIGTPLKHDKEVYSAAFNPDGSRVVTASGDNTARLWDAQSGAAIGAPLKHESWVTSASFSPDGTRVVTASHDHTVRLWDTQSGAAIGAPLKHEGQITSAAFSPDGRRVVTASWDYTARIWEVQSGAAISGPIKHEHGVRSAAFSPDGTRVVTASFDNTARLWDAQSGAAIGTPLKHDKEVYSAAFSSDGTRVVTASSDNTARIWDVQTAEMLGAPVTPEDLIALSGRRIADNGQLESLPGPEWMALINQVKAGANRGTTRKDQLMRWHFADPATRTISPFSQITVPQHIEREIAWALEHLQTEKPYGTNYSPKILDEAYNLDPGHPLILLALSVFEARPETKALWKRLSFPRFEKDARLAVRAAEILLIDKDTDNARKAAELALNLPGATGDDKTKAQAVLAKLVDGAP
ncbi:MAG: hypothetical protein JNN30_10405 [Rhodanobacteraceae bacterium]|nr:hypothetical protein [Rhodanobacteraceae bacterium]